MQAGGVALERLMSGPVPAAQPQAKLVDPESVKRVFETLLQTGGDDRSLVNPRTGLTKYNGTMKPSKGVHRSSCTMSVPTELSYEYGRALVESLLSRVHETNGECDTFTMCLDDIRSRLRSVWKLENSTAISLLPSGTDAELVPLLVALSRSFRAQKQEPDQKFGVLTIVSAAGEVGSGTTNAACGKTFAACLPERTRGPAGGKFAIPCGPSVSVGEDIFPLFESIAAMEVTLRDAITGDLKDLANVDKKVERIVEQAVSSGHYRCVLVHAVCGCKTGHLIPSVGCIRKLQAKYGKTILPIMDACQMRRVQELSLRRFLELGFAVLTTGSKFYGGPPFSGACLLPESMALELQETIEQFPEFRERVAKSQMKGFFNSSLFSDDLPGLRDILPKKHNYGLLLRWALGLHEIERFHQVPEQTREQIIREWVSGARKIIAQTPGSTVQLLEDPDFLDGPDASVAGPLGQSDLDCEAKENSIVGFGLAKTGTELLANVLKVAGLRGTLAAKGAVSKHFPSIKPLGLFTVEDGVRDYKKLFEQNPNAKFILTTAGEHSGSEEDEDMDTYLTEVCQFFSQKRSAGKLLVLDMQALSDQEIWKQVLPFVTPAGAVSPAALSAAVAPAEDHVAAASDLVRQAKSPRSDDGVLRTSVHDAELLSSTVNSIISFELKKPVEGKAGQYESPSVAELKRVHQLMATDLASYADKLRALLPESPQFDDLRARLAKVLGTRCFIAQPVSLNRPDWSANIGCLRIAIGAPLVSWCHDQERKELKSLSAPAAGLHGGVQAAHKEDTLIGDKLVLIMEGWAVTKSIPL